MRSITKHFVLVFALAAVLAVLSPASAQSSAGAAEYARATRLLTAGKDFNQAITLLQSAVRVEPNNSDYHLALGCAYADRAASLSFAYTWAFQIGKDTSDKPPAGFHVYTKDDDEPFRLTQPQAEGQIAQLNKSAHAEWQAAVRLSTSSAGRANAEYTEGWGVWALGVWAPRSGMPDHAGTIKAFKAATSDGPSVAVYWESLGYASSNFESTDTADYEHALRLQPNNPALWYKLFLNDVKTARYESPDFNLEKGISSPAGKNALSEIEQCVAQEPANAFPMYELAFVELDSTPYTNNGVNDADANTAALKAQADVVMEKSLTPADKEQAQQALTLMEQAVKAPQCTLPSYVPPIPSVLKPVWDYFSVGGEPLDLESNGHLRELARDLVGVSAGAEIEHNIPQAIEAERENIRMGQQLIGDWSVPPKLGVEMSVEGLVGIAIADIGYADLVRIEQQFGTPADAASAQAQYADFKSKATAYTNSVEAKVLTNAYSLY